MQVASQIYLNGGQRAERTPLGVTGTGRDEDRRPRDVVIHDLSASGCLIEFTGTTAVGAGISVGVPGLGVLPARVIRVDGTRVGCSFLMPLPANAVDMVRSADPVVTLPLAKPLQTESTMPEPDRWSRSSRLALLLLATVVPWILLLITR